jgi:antibiotic biosynthesis monooxygenase (ABM) superfamily enzyme
MIARICRCWTAHQHADAFEALLRTESIPGFLAKGVPGLREAEVFRLERLGEAEFMLILWFDDLEAARALAVARGLPEEDYENSAPPPRVRDLARRFEPKVKHYDLVETAQAASVPTCSRSKLAGAPGIARVWHAWTAHQNADAYERVLRNETFPGVLAKNVAGLRELRALRLERLGETEFLTIMYFDDMEAARALAVARDLPEDDYDRSVVSQKAREVLRRYDSRVEHYEVKESARPRACSSPSRPEGRSGYERAMRGA